MRLKLEFKYQCEVEFKEEEINIVKDNLKRDDLVPYLSDEINNYFLERDGRTEAGKVIDFDYKWED